VFCLLVLYVSPKSENFSVSITDEPKIVAGNSFVSNKDLRNIIKFILINKAVLLEYWDTSNNEVDIDNDNIVDKIKHI